MSRNGHQLGEILDAAASVEEMGERIFQLSWRPPRARSSKETKSSEREDEFAPWNLARRSS